MKVSVLVPVYRTDPGHLREAISSVLGQSFCDFELLIQDDCPDDDRASVVAEFKDPRISYRANERNLGISATRNLLLARARGEYLAVFDHDDVCRPDRFEKQVAYLDAHPECGVVSSQVRRVPQGAVTAYPTDDRGIRLALMDHCAVWHPAAMIRRSVLEECGVAYEAEYSPTEDYMLWMKLIGRTRFANLPEALTDYRWHETNTSVLRKDELDAAEMRCKAWAETHLPELYREYLSLREVVTRYRVFGIPVLKKTENRKFVTWKLFNHIPLLTAYRRPVI